MSGEIEEPVGLSFQADSLHSGSISFGRFENEVLSWEKRSSFSHNRYVEEVEKCLKPGSVIERKAYFEAHFKKKGFPKPNLVECYSGSNHQVSENDVLESDAYREEFEDGNEDNGCAHFDETSEGSEYHGDFEVKECEKEDPEVSLSDPQRASELNDEHILVDIKDDNPEETHQTGIGCDMFSSSIDEPETDVNENHNGDAVNADESHNSVNMNPKTAADEEVNITIVESLHNSSSKLKAGKESKISKSRVKSKASISPVKKSISAESSKVPTNKSNTREREGTRRADKEKLSSKTAIPPTHSVRRTPKSEDSTKLKGKSAHESRSDKEFCVKNLGEPQPPGVKPESRGRQMENRLNQRVHLTKSDTRSSVATFNFKSSERAERRKEFFTKMEEKMHAKEDEMNKIQARKQEKNEAEIKQFRKSLNFKAAPMPSFYHSAVNSVPDGSKAVSTKSSKVQSMSTNPGSGATSRLPSHSETGKSNAPTDSDSVNTTDLPEASRETNFMMAEPSEASSVSSTTLSGKNLSRDTTKGEATRMKEREKNANTQKHRSLESGKMAKSHKTEGKQKVGGERNSREMARKGVKVSVGFGSSSRMGHLTVGVAS
ncbi:protein WVD2-like 7 isoform X2 [Pyrus x bretschneideri]|uniref:protein WVD2-like 7 isoform X2 n=1 Tax=Pyrus x bretschneideri TaxID=225117 RepID=UPI00202FED2F|nr:protein WVD2-like 7 isoform X2 [Pyrus x bretschneideri]